MTRKPANASATASSSVSPSTARHLAMASCSTLRDGLAGLERGRERTVQLIADRLEAGARPGVAHDRLFLRLIDARRHRVVSHVYQLLLRNSGAPTEHHVRRYSVVAAVDRARGQVG